MSGKLIATVGDTHTCPMVNGTVPHVGGTIITGYSKMLVNNKPVARMGDKVICTGCGMTATIIQGDANILVGGMPIAYVGCMHSHGGVITSGQSNAFISGNKPPKIVTMPIELIEFENITYKNKVLAALAGQAAKLKEAAANQQDLKEQIIQNSDEKREITLETTYPLDELNEYAIQFGASFFTYAMQAIFGDSVKGKDLPLHAYDYLYRDLSDKKVEMPEIKIHTGLFPEAKYKSSDNTIWIAQYLIVKATEEKDIESMGKLYQAIMEEFGHYIDFQLRNHYTTLGGDAKLDEGAIFGYCLTTFNVFEETTINFGKATLDGTPYDLIIDLTEIQQQIDELVTQERIKRDEQKNDEEYFSAGKLTLKEAGGFTHYGIEYVLRDNKILDSDVDLNYVYLGNLLRDWSQLITPSTERYTKTQKQQIINALGLEGKEKEDFFGMQFLNPIKLSRKHLSFVIELIAAHELVGDNLSKDQIGAGKGDGWVDLNPKKATDAVADATNEASSIKKWILEKGESLGLTALEFSLEYYMFSKNFPKITSDMIGVYRPEEHIDNPIGACVVDLEKNEYLYWGSNLDTDINNHFGMKSYIRNYDYDAEKNNEKFTISQTGVKPNNTKLATASGYLTGQLEKSFAAHKKGDKKLSLLHFGNAMHTIEDYFAHSNFVELSLIKLGYSDIIPWVNPNDPKAKQFNKVERKTSVFDERLENENYFDSKTKVGNFLSSEQLYKTYPEAKTPIFSDKTSFTFEKGGATYEFIHDKRAFLELKGELHILRGVAIIKDTQRKDDYLNHLPVVTGKFGSLDMIHSLSDKLETMFETDAFSWKDAISSEWEGKPIVRIIDLIVLTVLTDLKYAQNSEEHKSEAYQGIDYATIIEYYEYIITFRGVVFGVLEKAKKGKGWLAVGALVLINLINGLEKALMNVIKMVMQFIIHGVAIGIRESQNLQKLDTNPTHTQIAKDDMEHPLHLLAGNLARVAVADIGKQFSQAKLGRTSEKKVLELAREYLSHPNDVNWMDVTTMKWASNHIGSINKAESKGFLDAFQKKHHKHIEHLSHSKQEFLENISQGIGELKKFYEKAKDMEKDLEISNTINESIDYIKQKLKF